MYVKKTTGYVVSAQNDDTHFCEKPFAHQTYRVVKSGRGLTQKEETVMRFAKSTDIASMVNQGLVYYQVIGNPDCKRCEEHNGAIYPVAEANDGENLPPFHPNCKCTIQGYSSANPNHDPWKAETLL